MVSRCEAGLLRGTYARCRGVSTDQTTSSVVTDEGLTFGLKSWSRGQKSQSASQVCAGGVSAVIGSSDLVALTLVTAAAPGNQLSCSLPFQGWLTEGGSGVPAAELRVHIPFQGRKLVFCPTSMHQAQNALIQRGRKRSTTTKTVPMDPMPRTTASAGSTQTQSKATTTPRPINNRK